MGKSVAGFSKDQMFDVWRIAAKRISLTYRPNVKWGIG